MSEFYKKYRPKKLSKILGNEETVQSLQNMLERKRVPHTILFHGPSGCGKTSLARILRKELQCSEMDYTEMNCSDFRGIDTIRDIVKRMSLAPVAGTCRVFTMDEVHQLSKDAQNAALKMLEDTPAHVYFFLCTTDPQKLIKTILNRCTEMPVETLKEEQLLRLTKRIARREKIELEQDIKEDLVEAAEGSARSLLILLEKLANLKPVQRAKAIKQKKDQNNEAIDLCRALLKKRPWAEIRKILNNLKSDPEQTRWAVMGYASAVLLRKKDDQAYVVLCSFENHFYDSKKNGLIRACYEATHG